MGAKHRFLGKYVEGHDVNPVAEPWQYRKTSKKGTMYVGSHHGLPNWWKKRHKAIKGGEAALTNRWVLQEVHRRICTCLFKRLKSGKKTIPAPKAVRLNDRKEGKLVGQPPVRLEGRVTHFRDVWDDQRVLGTGLVSPGGEDPKALRVTGARGACRRRMSGGYKVHLTETRPARESRGCLVAIDGHIHGFVTNPD